MAPPPTKSLCWTRRREAGKTFLLGTTKTNPDTMKTKLNSLVAGASALAVCALLASGCQSNQTACCTARFTSAAAAPAGKATLKFVKVDSEETAGEDGKGANAVDGDANTFWHTQWQDASPPCPHEIILELTPPAAIKGFTYLPRQDDSDHGEIKDYEFYVSNDGVDFGQPAAKGAFEAGKELKTVALIEPQTCRFIKLKALSEINGEAWSSDRKSTRLNSSHLGISYAVF